MNAGTFSPLGLMLVECKTMDVESLPSTPVWVLLITPAIDEATIGLDAVTAEQAEDVITLMIRSVATISEEKLKKRALTMHRTYSALADLIACATTQRRLKAMPFRYKEIVIELAQTAPQANIDLRYSMLDFTLRHAWKLQAQPKTTEEPA